MCIASITWGSTAAASRSGRVGSATHELYVHVYVWVAVYVICYIYIYIYTQVYIYIYIYTYCLYHML